MRWRAASTSARSGTDNAVMARVYHGPPEAMSQRAGPATMPQGRLKLRSAAGHRSGTEALRAHTMAWLLKAPPRGAAMTALDATADGSPQLGGHAEEATAQAATVGPLAGDPATLGLPSFIVGSVALGLVLVGVVPPTAVGASLPIILAATSAGLFVATIWSAAIGQSAVASVFGIFAGFWLSYAVLVVGLIHNWFGITASAAQSTQELFLTA